jgi:hypothetical protein
MVGRMKQEELATHDGDEACYVSDGSWRLKPTYNHVNRVDKRVSRRNRTVHTGSSVYVPNWAGVLLLLVDTSRDRITHELMTS